MTLKSLRQARTLLVGPFGGLSSRERLEQASAPAVRRAFLPRLPVPPPAFTKIIPPTPSPHVTRRPLSRLTWLKPSNYGLQQRDFLKKLQEETGQWLLDSETFKSWESSTSNQRLFIQGIPGLGYAGIN